VFMLRKAAGLSKFVPSSSGSEWSFDAGFSGEGSGINFMF
jgi:hypothetical protein